jgi:alpha-L-fucosidase
MTFPNHRPNKGRLEKDSMQRQAKIISALGSMMLGILFTTTYAAKKPPEDPNDTGGVVPANQSAADKQIAQGGNAQGFDMAPETKLAVVEAAVAAIPEKIPAGPFQPTWESLKQNYKSPKWFFDAKFGIFMHWGLYSVPAHGTGGAAEWYEKHLYGGGETLGWHTKNFGSPDVFGYKNFIPKFTADKWDPDAWATLFKKAGAKYVVPTAQHHDNFSLWDSQVNPWNAKAMGPKRDLIGDLAKAVRAQGLKFGVSNHGIEAFQFVNPNKELAATLKEKQADLYDPKWAEFYHVADRSDEACKRFLVNWAERNVELIDKYQPDMLWFDNGVDMRFIDPLKLWVAAYYYNRAVEWKKDVSITTKKAAYAPQGMNTKTIGSIIDFEKIGGRSPAGIRTGEWQVDDPIGSSWGYSEGMRVSPPGTVVGKLVDTVSQNGNLLLNISPKADGTIPQDQQDTLLEVGKWLDVNGEAIYGTHAWIKCSDGNPGKGELNIRYTVKGETLYAILVGKWPSSVTLKSLASGQASEGTITGVSLLGGGALNFRQTSDGLKIDFTGSAPCKYAYAVKITGLKMNPSTWTESGNPQ